MSDNDDDDDDDDDDVVEMTDGDIKWVKRSRVRDERWKWARGEIKMWTGYFSAAVGIVYAGWDYIMRLPAAVAHLFKGSS